MSVFIANQLSEIAKDIRDSIASQTYEDALYTMRAADFTRTLEILLEANNCVQRNASKGTITDLMGTNGLIEIFNTLDNNFCREFAKQHKENTSICFAIGKGRGERWARILEHSAEFIGKH